MLGAVIAVTGTTVTVFPSSDRDTVCAMATSPTVRCTDSVVTVLRFTGSENSARMGLCTQTSWAPCSGTRDTTRGGVRSTTTSRLALTYARSPRAARASSRYVPSASPAVSQVYVYGGASSAITSPSLSSSTRSGVWPVTSSRTSTTPFV
ncbi:hypothetical protein BHS04_36245 [Myxococcus xanthus]|nr:hypothetical protein BHS04_36245 [Myxococcus xanthus]